MVLIFIFSHKEPLLVSVAGQWSFHGIDKIAHFCEFFLLFFLLFRTLYLERYKNPELKSLCFSVFYSISDEFHQSFLPYRDCELGDVMADTSGVLAGFILLLLYKKYRGKETLLSRQLIES
jgi:VanZ family protein